MPDEQPPKIWNCPHCDGRYHETVSYASGKDSDTTWWARVDCACGAAMDAEGKTRFGAIDNAIKQWNRRA